MAIMAADTEAGPEHAGPDRSGRRAEARGPAVAPIAAISTSPSRPMPRSISTTVVASVLPAARAVSAMRMTSPPMLLGRKLLKNVATRNEPRQRLEREAQVLGAKQQAPAPGARQRPSPGRAPSAAKKPGAEALRATAHSRATSTREKSSHSSARLTTVLSEWERGRGARRPMPEGAVFR